MCLICVEFARDRITLSEARRNLREMVVEMDEEHLREVTQMLDTAEKEEEDVD